MNVRLREKLIFNLKISKDIIIYSQLHIYVYIKHLFI